MDIKEQKWKGYWITTERARISKEPEFTLEEMFSGKLRPQLRLKSVCIRLFTLSDSSLLENL